MAVFTNEAGNSPAHVTTGSCKLVPASSSIPPLKHSLII